MVGGKDVQAAVSDVGGDADHGVKDPLDGGPYSFLGGSVSGEPGGVDGAPEVEEVGSFGFVELLSLGDAFEDVFRGAVGVAVFEAGVVLD